MTSETILPPDQWATGEEPMTDKQDAFLHKLLEQRGVDIDSEGISKSHASELIDELKNRPTSKNGGPKDQVTVEQPDELVKKPSEWATGEEPATAKQQGYVAVLAKRAGETVPKGGQLTKSEASEKIDELKTKTGQ